jgi:hypothetical protein
MTMINVLKKTLAINSGNESTTHEQLTFIKTRKAVLKELQVARENSMLIGVYSRALGEGMFLVGVSDIETNLSSEVIVLETYDQSGSILNRTRLSIDEIKMVCPLHKKYLNPVLNKVIFQ